jgi:two-component system, OmpR family, sensor histidine kinase SenX3
MHEDSDRLLRLVEQVLHSARTPRHGLVHRMPVDMRQLLSESLDVARSRHHLTHDAIEYRDTLPEGAPATVLGDPEELKVAVSNLIDNAIKYSGPDVHVALELASADSKRLAIRVRDTGIGISPPELKRIFRRFYRIPGIAATRVKGTGLGLFIVRSVARKHGGRVVAESGGPGHGSTFTLSLPITPDV